MRNAKRKLSQQVNPMEVLNDFLLMRQAQGLTEFTTTREQYYLRTFFERNEVDLNDTKALTQAIGQFLSEKKTGGYYNKVLQAFRQFFKYCVDEGIVNENPSLRFKFKDESARIIQHDQDTIKTLLDLPDKSSFAGFRDYTFMLVMLDNGIRPYELLQIKPSDVDLVNNQMIVREEYAKTRQLRVLPLSGQTVSCLKKLINARHEKWSQDSPVFCTYTGRRQKTCNLQERFRNCSKKLGVDITPYHLRHTFALWYIRNGGSAFSLKTIMGHSTLEMTQLYVNLVDADIKNSHMKASPVNTIFNKPKPNSVTRMKR